MSEEDVAVAERAVRFWNAGDRESFLALFDPQAVWSSAIKRQGEGGEGLYRGREELGAFWDEWHDVWSDLNIVISEVRSPRDGCVFAFGALRGSGTGSGVGTERPFGWVFQVEDGLIREVRAYINREDALAAAGLSE
jgi:ketosteroid isomerase-like protein